jgi:hypothetical protein
MAPDESCWIGVLRLVLRVPGARSLKDKRRAVAQIRDRLRARKNLSVAETGHLEDHQHAILSVAMVANDQRFVRSQLDQVAHAVSSWRAALVVDATIQANRPWDAAPENQYDDFIDG